MTQSVLNPPTVRAALALELAPGSSARHAALAQHEAGALATLIARDLAGFAADAAQLDLALVGAHYDPVELLRPGWPLHRELERLSARAPGEAGARVIAFGTHRDRLPEALAPAQEHAGGPLRLLPLVLTGEAAAVAGVGAQFEQALMERGMAGAETALRAQDAFGLRVEHARYLTLHDLCAMTALQYEHAGLAALWPLLETALLAPDEEAWLDAPPEPLLHYIAGEVRIALFSPDGWRARHAADDEDEARLERGFARFEARQRQLAALLQAHGIPVTYSHCRSRVDPHDELA
ncbi:hypothetical protein [Luteimonas suaedae]|uniref:hypothetical protein n=1 Tax=Luteimonas suaedae TaxID=2605430 RepID=UPI0011EF51CF|nr:hypothetical protein [Luteimonas suaedae]